MAALCVQYESEFRPSMSIVVKALSPLLINKPQQPLGAPDTPSDTWQHVQCEVHVKWYQFSLVRHFDSTLPPVYMLSWSDCIPERNKITHSYGSPCRLPWQVLLAHISCGHQGLLQLIGFLMSFSLLYLFSLFCVLCSSGSTWCFLSPCNWVVHTLISVVNNALILWVCIVVFMD